MKHMKTAKLAALVMIVGLLASLAAILLSGQTSATMPTDEQMLAALRARIEKAGVEIESATTKSELPHLLSFQIDSVGEPLGVCAYKVYRQATLAQLSGLPVGWVEVLAYDEQGQMVFGEGNLIDAREDTVWQITPTIELQAVNAQLWSVLVEKLPGGIQCSGVNISTDQDGYRMAAVDLGGDASILGGDEFRDFLASTRVEAIAANEQGAGIAAVTVRVTDSTGQLLLWDINDLQLGMRAGWHSPAFMPGWLSLPAPPQP